MTDVPPLVGAPSAKRGSPVRMLAGMRFNGLVSVSFAYRDKNRNAYWVFLCDCGAEKVLMTTNAIRGLTKSCGCRRSSKNNETVHPLHNTYRLMIRRCYDETSKDWKSYGGRGIRVCDAWLKSFEQFVKDVGPRPEGMTLDRKNNNSGYGPDNFRWATKLEQSRNRRNVKNHEDEVPF